MKDFEKLEEVFNYMVEFGMCAFVDDFTGWGEEAEVKGFRRVSAPEGNALVSEKTGKSYEPQYATVRRSNHLEIQLRSHKANRSEVDKRVSLGEIFSDTDIVIVTSGESVRTLAPVLNRRSELIVYIAQLQNYCQHRRDIGKPTPWYWEGDMMDLAIFLYQNCEDRIEDKSIYDRI